MKTLAEFLADYIEQEVVVSLPDNGQMYALSIRRIYEIVKQGIDAYQSTEDCIITVIPLPGNPADCEHCCKCGETTCGNDIQNHSCFEPKE